MPASCSIADEREQRAAMPLRSVEDAEHLLAGIRHLLLDPHLVRVQIHQTALETEAARAEEALVDPRRAQHVGAEVADERHRRQPQHAAGDENRDARRVGERRRDEQTVRDDDELALRAQLERQVVRGRARVERDRLALVDHLRGRARDRPLPLDLEAEPEVEPDLGLPVLERPHAATDARDETLAGERSRGRCGPLPRRPKTSPQVPQRERNHASRASGAPAASARAAKTPGDSSRPSMRATLSRRPAVSSSDNRPTFETGLDRKSDRNRIEMRQTALP